MSAELNTDGDHGSLTQTDSNHEDDLVVKNGDYRRKLRDQALTTPTHTRERESQVWDMVPMENAITKDTYMIPENITGTRQLPLEAELEDVQET